MATIITETGARREAVLRGLAEIADFLREHPDLPLAPPWFEEPFTVYVTEGTDEEKRAEVDRIAVILGVKAGFAPRSTTLYAAVRRFSGGVSYGAYAMGSRHKGATVRSLAPAGAAA